MAPGSATVPPGRGTSEEFRDAGESPGVEEEDDVTNSQDGARSVLVTGATRGIGRAIAEDFIASGDRVATIYRGGDLPEGVLGVRGDMRDTASIDEAFATIEAEHGPVEVLVANAGMNRDQLLMRMSDEDFAEVLDVNLTGTFRCARRAVRGMIRKRGGRIVFMSSVVATYGTPGQANYAAAKAGLIGMARSITRELGSRGITANVVAPGFIDTEMTQELPEERQRDYLAAIPAGRFGQVDDVVAAVRYLSSPAAGYVSGAVIPVDGGLGMGH